MAGQRLLDGPRRCLHTVAARGPCGCATLLICSLWLTGCTGQQQQPQQQPQRQQQRQQQQQQQQQQRRALRGDAGFQQVLIFDAGSSGTRVHVFNLRAPRGGASVPEVDLAVRERQTLKVKPGLSSFAKSGDLDGVRASIENLLAFANQFVPLASRASTPALLKATAGLRALPKESSDAVLRRVRDTLLASGYRFQANWASIIEGKEEGGLAWVAVNYLRGTFSGAADKESLGVIELGGGSMQVSFQVESAEVLAPSDKFEFRTAGGRRYRVYAHSYLGFGLDHAQAKLLEAAPPTEGEDPCYPVGYRRAKQMHNGTDGATEFIRGSGHADGCQAWIESALLESSELSPGRYAGERPLHGSFAATENFYHVRHRLSLPLVGDLEATRRAAHDVCCDRNQTGEADAMEFGVPGGKPHECFALSYMAALSQALGVSATPGVKVEVLKQVGGADVEWALGAAVTHALEGVELAADIPGGPSTWWGVILALLAVPFAVLAANALCVRDKVQHRVIKATTIGAPAE